MRCRAAVAGLLLHVTAAQAACADALAQNCGASKAGCTTFPCTACQTCVITNGAALQAAGCSAQEELDYCGTPPPPPPTSPPGNCGPWTDSRGDSYDLSGLVGIVASGSFEDPHACKDGRKIKFDVGFCSAACSGTGSGSEGGQAPAGPPGMCQHDPCDTIHTNPYNTGSFHDQSWADGPTAHQSVTLVYGSGEARACPCKTDHEPHGCPPVGRRSEVTVHCDACLPTKYAQMSLEEPSGADCVYKVNIYAREGCPTNIPMPPCEHPTPAPTQPAPTPAPMTPAPTPAPPLATTPCIRFAHTIPVPHHVDVEVSQTDPNPHTHTWENYEYAQFSDWVSSFEVGTGAVKVWESVNGTRGALLLTVADIPLTPGPLVVALKCPQIALPGAPQCWPPADAMLGASIETFAASYVPVSSGAAVRLVNVAPETKEATLSAGGVTLGSAEKYGEGFSKWAHISANATDFVATDTSLSAPVATLSAFAPPAAPQVFTTWLLGNHSAASGPYAEQLKPVLDAPHNGEYCTPVQRR